jgi:hypothetical protein
MLHPEGAPAELDGGTVVWCLEAEGGRAQLVSPEGGASWQGGIVRRYGGVS